MTDHACPLNQRPCRCDPNATEAKFRPCALARQIGTMIRMIGEEREEVAISAMHGLRRLLPGKGLAFSDLAILVENANGEIEQLKYSDQDAEKIFAKGRERGREEQARQQYGSAKFFDADGRPHWNAIALFCQDHHGKLKAHEQQFVDDMTGKTLSYEPTEKQAKWLLAIFYRLGGRRQ